MPFEESIIITGGRLIVNDDSKPNQVIKFKRTVINPRTNVEDDFVTVSCNFIVNKENYLNIIRTLEDFKMDEELVKKTNNLVILPSKKKPDTSYELEISGCQMNIDFVEKGHRGLISLTMNIDDTIKTDHGTKTDHPSMPH